MASKFHCTIMDMNNPKNETWKKMLSKSFKNYKRKGSIQLLQ